jgi:outer membrane receptor protein involved in Fe transport
MFKRICFLISLFLLVSYIGWSQNGKIHGVVTDKQTKEPLIGASILISGTSMGAASGLDGSYNILNLSPGTYDVKATYVGYQEITVKGLQVVSGLTAEVNFAMSSTAIEISPIEIIAQRPLIEKSATNAIRIMSSEELQNLPVRGAVGYFSLQPGVVLQDGNVYIRGSRPDEVGYMVEGADTKNIMDRDGGSLITIIPDALENILVQAGGYTAEFGGANAGIVQQNLKTGSEKYHGSLQLETDNFSSLGGNTPSAVPSTFLGTNSYGYSDYVFTLSGPVVADNIKAYIAGENYFTRDYNPMFFSGSPTTWSDGAPVGKVYDTGVRGGDPTTHLGGDSQYLYWQPGVIPGRFQNRYSMNGSVLFDYKPLLVKVGGTLSWQRQRDNDFYTYAPPTIVDPIANIYDLSRLQLTDQSQDFLTMKASYFIGANSFLEANFSYLDRRNKSYDPNFSDNNILLYADSLAAAQRGWLYPAYAEQPGQYDFYGFPFNRTGTLLVGPTGNQFNKSETGNWSGSVAYTSQIGKNEIKVGGSYEDWTARNYSITGLPSLLTISRLSPDIARVSTDYALLIRRQTSLNNYGYDEFGNPIDSGPDNAKHPKFIGAYAEDKIEFSDLIINGGLRFDWMDMDSWDFVNPYQPYVDKDNYTIPQSVVLKNAAGGDSVVQNLKKTNPFNYLSPRLGFSFPVTDRTVFHLQFGKFVQSPGLDEAYRGLAAAAQQIIGGYYFTNPIAYSLEPTRTTQYEIGFSQQFTDFASFDMTAFYKDIKGQVQYYQFYTNAGWTPSVYSVYNNGDFATTDGLEFRLTLRRTNRVQATVNYTLSDAQGTNSFPTSAGGALQTGASSDPNATALARPTMVSPLDYDQTHRGSINFDYRFGKNDGGPILERLGLNLLFTFNSGHRFTQSAPVGLGQQDAASGGILNNTDSRNRLPIEPVNASATPWNFNMDMRLDKTVTLAGLDLDIYAYIQNVFNTQNVINVYYATGNAYSDGFLENSANAQLLQNLGNRFTDLYRVINLQDRRANLDYNGFDLFGPPRQIRFGIRAEL